MMTSEVETSRVADVPKVDVKRIQELEHWFRTEYRNELDAINRYNYLGIAHEKSRYSLELEAYEKEQELRRLTGKEPLPEIKFKKII